MTPEMDWALVFREEQNIEIRPAPIIKLLFIFRI